MRKKAIHLFRDSDNRLVGYTYPSRNRWGKKAYRFRVIGGNNRTLAPSQAYTRESDAVRGFFDLQQVLQRHVYVTETP